MLDDAQKACDGTSNYPHICVQGSKFMDKEGIQVDLLQFFKYIWTGDWQKHPIQINMTSTKKSMERVRTDYRNTILSVQPTWLHEPTSISLLTSYEFLEFFVSLYLKYWKTHNIESKYRWCFAHPEQW